MSMPLVLRCLALLICLLHGARVHASEVGQPVMASWGAAEIGLVAQLWRVRVLADGRVAIGHNRGLSLFDGTRFELLALPGGTALDFRVAADGESWAGTPSGLGSFVVDPQGLWRFKPRPLPANAPPPGPIGRVLLSGGWTHFLARQTAYAWHPQHGWRWHPATTRFAELREADGAVLLFEPGTGWWRFDAGTGQWQPHVWPDFPAADIAASSEEAGEPWYFSDRQQIWRQEGGRFEVLAVQHLPELQAARIESLARLPGGGVAVGTRFAGLYQFDAAGALTRRVAPAQLPGERVSDIDVDAQGQLWLAIDGGLVRIAPDDHLSRWDRRLGAFQVERIVRAGATLYVPTRVGLKQLLPPDNPGEPARLQFDRISRTSVWDLLPTAFGGVLVGTGNGLMWLPDDGDEARLLQAGPRVSALVAADAAATLVYAVAGDRLWRIRRNATDYVVDAAEFRFLPMHDIRLQDGRLWASIDGGGAVSFSDLANWPALTVRRFGEGEGVHRDRLIFSQGFDPLLLLGSTNHQVTPAGDLAPPTALQGLPLLDQLVRIGGDRYRAIHTDGALLHLRRGADGRLQLDGEPLAGMKLPSRHLLGEDDGTLWLGGEEGLARVDSAFVTPPAATLRPWIASVHGGAGQLLWAGASAPLTALTVPADARQLDIQFALPGLRTELPPKWAWRTAADPSWVPLERAALHWLVPSAGAQQLMFRATDANGRAWLSTPLDLQVLPLWHEHPLARLGFAVVGLLLLAVCASGWAHWRTRQLQRERTRLEAEVQMRTAEVRRQADEIRSLSEARTRFFAHVSHEFRTPLTLVLGPVGDALAGRHGALSTPLAGALRTVRSSAERLLKLVNELLDLSRLAAGRFDLHLAEHDLAAQLRRELAGFATEAERRQLRLEGEGLSDPLLLAYDADQLERIVANLLGNALKFTPIGGRVTLRVVPTASEVGIEVEDSGPGVPVAEQARIFERFQQGSAAAPPEAPGTGIGLALVRELVELHGGRVELISEAGQGACFVVWLPRRPAASLTPPEIVRAEARAIPPADPVGPVDIDDGLGEGLGEGDPDDARAEALGQRPTVLVVDDHAEVRRYLADRLADAFEVRSARDGDEALALIAEVRPDVLVSDVMMPGLDGIGLLRVLRSDPDTAGVPVLLLSARAQSRDVIAGLEAGADDYLTKPFETGELIARLKALLERRRWLRRDLLARGALLPGGVVAVETAAIPAATLRVDASDSGTETPGADASDSGAETPGAAASDSGTETSGADATGAAEQRFRERLERCLSAHVGDADFGVAALAEALHMDRATLFRRVKSLTGGSPSELLRERRLVLAHALLQQRRGNVSEVAYAVGYESLSHFAQAFRRRYGVAPSALLGTPPT